MPWGDPRQGELELESVEPNSRRIASPVDACTVLLSAKSASGRNALQLVNEAA